jgi:hypothetical protein
VLPEWGTGGVVYYFRGNPMDIDLHANDLRLWIGMPFNERELSSAQISKAGLFTDLIMSGISHQRGDTMYWVKNPNLSCFNGAAVAIPNAKFNAAINSTDYLCGTSVFLYFNSGYLRMALFQVLKSFTWAQRFTNEFRQAASKSFGNAECSDLTSIPEIKGSSIKKQMYLKCGWSVGKESLLSQLAPAGNQANVYWGMINIG